MSSGKNFSLVPTVLLSLALGVAFGVFFLLLFNPAVKRNAAAATNTTQTTTAQTSQQTSGQSGADAQSGEGQNTAQTPEQDSTETTAQTASATRQYNFFTGQTGAELYVEVCQSCHMPGGKGAEGGGGVYNYPALAGNPKLASAPYVQNIVLNGNGGMPGFAHYLSDEQAAKIVDYVRMELNDNTDATKLEDLKNLRPPEDKELTFGEAAG